MFLLCEVNLGQVSEAKIPRNIALDNKSTKTGFESIPF